MRLLQSSGKGWGNCTFSKVIIIISITIMNQVQLVQAPASSWFFKKLHLNTSKCTWHSPQEAGQEEKSSRWRETITGSSRGKSSMVKACIQNHVEPRILLFGWFHMCVSQESWVTQTFSWSRPRDTQRRKLLTGKWQWVGFGFGDYDWHNKTNGKGKIIKQTHHEAKLFIMCKTKKLPPTEFVDRFIWTTVICRVILTP